MTIDELQKKIAEWTDRLDGKDYHSIGHQIHKLTWRSAFYRAINESREHLKEGNGTLHGFINDAYIELHATAVRRLTDRSAYHGERGVNSLYSLVSDIKGCARHLTRAKVLAARGLVYDYQPITDRALNDSYLEAGGQAHFVSGEGCAAPEHWHSVWDTLCGTTQRNRQPNDRPADGHFDTLLKGLELESKHIHDVVNKRIAHAATPESREVVPPAHLRVSLDILWRAERVVLRVYGFVARCFGSGSASTGVSAPQFDLFEHLDKPFASQEGLDAMEWAWREHDHEASDCGNWMWNQPLADAPIPQDILDYNAAQSPGDRRICDELAEVIHSLLAGAMAGSGLAKTAAKGADRSNADRVEAKVWHRHPVWFIDGNPIVGYSKLKDCIRLLFWSGRSFDEPGLLPEGKFKAAEARFTSVDQVSAKDLRRWLAKSVEIQWDYKNIVKRKGRLERLK